MSIRKTKIICTLGPAVDDEEMIRTLIRTGMDAARFNFSHGDHQEHLGRLNKLKAVRDAMGRPVATILDTKGPEIRTRAFGTTAEAVEKVGPWAAYGLMDGGVIPVVKHFPGHGDTATDSHVGLPTVSKTVDELLTSELIPFQSAIEGREGEGVPAVMVAHILMTAIDQEHPASLSRAVVTGLLREQMGFNGVVFTDDLTMGAITENYGLDEAAVLALEAGCDVLLVCHNEGDLALARQAVLDAVAAGRLTEERIDQSVYRILSLKQAYSLTNDPVEKPNIQALNQEIAALNG